MITLPETVQSTFTPVVDQLGPSSEFYNPSDFLADEYHRQKYFERFQRLTGSLENPFVTAQALEQAIDGNLQGIPNYTDLAYSVKQVKKERKSILKKEEEHPKKIKEYFEKKATAGFEELLKILNSVDISSLKHEPLSRADVSNRFLSYVSRAEAQDVFAALELAISTKSFAELSVDKPLKKQHSHKLILFAAAVAYAQTRLTDLLKKDFPDKDAKFRHAVRNQVLIYALQLLGQFDPELVKYFFALHYKTLEEPLLKEKSA